MSLTTSSAYIAMGWQGHAASLPISNSQPAKALTSPSPVVSMKIGACHAWRPDLDSVRIVRKTRPWVSWMLGDIRLSARERTVLDDLPSGQRPRLCDISLWEVAMLVQLGRLRLEDALEDWLRIAASPAAVEVIFITLARMSYVDG